MVVIGHLVSRALRDASCRLENPEAAGLRSFGDAARQAVLFRMPDTIVLDGVDFGAMQVSEIRAPFPVTIMEWSTGKYVSAVVVTDGVSQSGARVLEMVSTAWLRNGPEKDLGRYDRYRLENGERLCVWEMDDGGRWTPIPDRIESTETCAWMVFQQAIVWLALISCSNVGTVDHAPAKFAQRKRAAQGRPPLLAYKTLLLECPGQGNPKGEPKGGTHASPRQHVRRGHFRHLADGRTIWVNSCVVGDDANGAIVKDYAIKGAKKDAD